jgi:2-dehydro-3-deoxy-D-arabinonate dehydratase
MQLRLYRTTLGCVVERAGQARLVKPGWRDFFRAEDPLALALASWNEGRTQALAELGALLAPIEAQEVWAAGVTYYRSRDARMEESQDAAGGDFYARVYEAQRPELFFKSSAQRAVGHGGQVRLRRDSEWNVPEPELVLAVGSSGHIFGYTVGNDMSSRDIEGQNPLYLAQAKVYDGSCALGPAVLLSASALPSETKITLHIRRDEATVFAGDTSLAQLKREPRQLVEYLFRDQSFPDGVFLMTGTGIVPGADFSLQPGDEIAIEIAGVGRLVNRVRRD